MPAGGLKSRPAPDDALVEIADYASGYEVRDPGAYRMARLCLMDAMGCAIEALRFEECTRLLGPVVPGASFPGGARVPGTRYELEPVAAAFNIATMIRWLDFNDALAAAQGGHPSDGIGALLAVGDYLSRQRRARDERPLTMRDVLTALIKMYEIQGVLSMENNFVRLALDYTALAKVAATSVVTQMLGGTRDQVVNAVSNAWADGANLTIFRHGNNTGPRKSWAGGDAASRAVWLALMALRGDMGYPSVISAKTFGYQNALMKGELLKRPRPYGEFVMGNLIAFKFVPAGMQGQSAAECAFRLHPLVKDRLKDIETIAIRSHERMMKIMDKRGPLTNPADRDHCVQYLVAVGLIHGKIGTSDFEDAFAADPRIDALRDRMTIVEDPQYTGDFHDPAKRTNTHSIEIRFKDGSRSPMVKVEYPLGHPPIHDDSIPPLEAKLERHLAGRFPPERVAAMLGLLRDQSRLESMPVDEFMEQFVG
jgi:2-methylcitrate dehydratase